MSIEVPAYVRQWGLIPEARARRQRIAEVGKATGRPLLAAWLIANGIDCIRAEAALRAATADVDLSPLTGDTPAVVTVQSTPALAAAPAPKAATPVVGADVLAAVRRAPASSAPPAPPCAPAAGTAWDSVVATYKRRAEQAGH